MHLSKKTNSKLYRKSCTEIKKKEIGEFVNKDRRYKLIEVIEKDINTLCLSKNWSYNLQSNTHILRGNNEKKKT